MKRILFLLPYMPYPPDEGGKWRYFSLITELAKRHEVYVCCFVRSPSESAAPLLRAGCKEVHLVLLANKKQSFFGIFSPSPRSVKHLMSGQMASLVDRFAAKGIDAVIVTFNRLASYAQKIPALKVLDVEATEDVFFMHDVLQEKNIFRKAVKALRHLKQMWYLKTVYRSFAVLTVVSEEERTRLVRNAPGSRVEVVRVGVDTRRFTPQRAQKKPFSLVFTGSLVNGVNRDAVEYYGDKIMPLVQKECPAALLSVTGRLPDVSEYDRIKRKTGIRLTGYLDDVRDEIASAMVVIAPFRTGGGVRVKILEAMAMGSAVVTTSIGAEGIRALHGEHLLIADSAEDFARAVVSLLRDEALRKTIGSKARELIVLEYTDVLMAKDLEKIIQAY